MSAAFAHIRPESTAPRRVMKTDLEGEDKAFKNNLAEFRNAISIGNPIVQKVEKQQIILNEKDEQKNLHTQVESNKGDIKNQKENVAFLKGSMDFAVESNHVKRPDGSLDQLPSLAPKGAEAVSKSNDDFFDDFLTPNQNPNKPSSPAAKEACPFDDPIAPVSAGMIDPFDDSPSPEKPSNVPSPQAKSEPKAVVQPVEQPQKATLPPIASKSSPSQLLEGFDMEKFVEVQDMINRALKNCPMIDLEQIEKTLPEYAVRLHLDHYRENPRIIDEKMAEVKDKQDSIQAIRRQIIPFLGRLQMAAETAEKIGVSCSSASSAEKRNAQIRIVCEELFYRYKIAKTILETVEEEYEHLQSQYEACSRLVSFYTSIHRGELPSVLPPVEKKAVPSVAVVNAPSVVASAGSGSEAGREVAPNVTRSVAELDDFPKAPAQMMPKTEVKGKGSRVVEF